MQLVARDIAHNYGGHQILNGVTFRGSTGHSYAITGPSGSGKTTLLAILAGLIAQQSGEVCVVTEDGTEVSNRDNCSIVLQTTNGFPRRTALENIQIGALSRGMSWERARSEAMQLVIALELEEAANRLARDLSGGELQRIVIARSIISGRPFILADEPTGQLDNRTSAHVFSRMLAAGASRGLIVVTHDLDIAAQCTFQYRLNSGHLEPA